MSALPRAAVCPASVVLPQRDYQTTFADDGNDRHAAMEFAVIERDFDKLPPKVAALLKTYVPESTFAELTLFYDFVNDAARTAERRTNRVERYASALPYEVPGTADVVAIDLAARVGLVVDWKGWEEVGAAAVNMQTTGYAIALAKLFDLDLVTVAIAYLGEGKQHVDIATIDAVDFDAWRVQLAALNLRVTAARRDPQPVISRHCRWCPAWEACPAQKSLALELRDDSALTRYEGMSLDDDATAADVYEFAQKAGVLLKRTKDALYARASHRPIPLRDGRWFGRVEKRGNLELVGDVVYDVIRAEHGQAIADKAVQRDATQASIKRALKAAGVKSVDGALKPILERVAKLDGSSRKTKIEIDVVDEAQLLRATPGAIAAGDALLQEAKAS